MKKKIQILTLTLVLGFGMSSCYTIEHTVGSGAQGGSTETARQWFALWGLVPISEADSKQMAGGATDYTIETKASFVDIVIGIFTGIVTIAPRTVTVTK
ncbi:MAG: hypothetical protein GY816_19885 [Cytophagales bacterium]|nr:hypothetical protein [Cytophagales bacterium]